MGGYVAVQTGELAAGGSSLKAVSRSTHAAGKTLGTEAQACSRALGSALAGTLARFAAAAESYAAEIQSHVEATGYLASNLATDFDKVGGDVTSPFSDLSNPYGLPPEVLGQ